VLLAKQKEKKNRVIFSTVYAVVVVVLAAGNLRNKERGG